MNHHTKQEQLEIRNWEKGRLAGMATGKSRVGITLGILMIPHVIKVLHPEQTLQKKVGLIKIT